MLLVRNWTWAEFVLGRSVLCFPKYIGYFFLSQTYSHRRNIKISVKCDVSVRWNKGGPDRLQFPRFHPYTSSKRSPSPPKINPSHRLCTFSYLEHHVRHAPLRQVAFGLLGPMMDGPKSRCNRVGRANTLSVRQGEVVERQQGCSGRL
jgi:hypothetical protein